jgi:uncharacterized protein with von Willebrand factor type A (vWA) domain
MDRAVPLEGLYLHLVRNGFPLSVRDFEDALTALRQGHGLHRRDDLRWLCEALWARTDQEVIRLERLFRAFPRPSREEIRALTGEGARTGETSATQQSERSRETPGETTTKPAQQGPAIDFGTPIESGLGLPRAQIGRRADDVFIFTPRPLVSLRALIVAWRRFRLAQRFGPPVELDIEATISEQCRRGMLAEPKLIPARRNQARLAVLVDASPSMVPWRHMSQLVADSLDASQLGHAAIYFFDNTPEEDLHETDALNRPVPLATALQDHRQCALLVVSDAGAARGRIDRGARLRQTRRFVERVRSEWFPIAWLNPMLRRRWSATTAERIAALPGIGMFELNDDGLIHAVDYLRGKRGV